MKTGGKVQIMNAHSLEIWIPVIAATLATIGYFTGFFKWIILIIKKILSYKPKLPQKSIIIVYKNTPFPQLFIWWHMGTRNGNPAMQVKGDILITNITEKNILLTGVILKKSKNRGEIIVKEANSNYFGNYPILPGHTTEASFHLWIEPPLKQEGQSFIDNVAILDQFGNKHWLKNVEFKYL